MSIKIYDCFIFRLGVGFEVVYVVPTNICRIVPMFALFSHHVTFFCLVCVLFRVVSSYPLPLYIPLYI